LEKQGEEGHKYGNACTVDKNSVPVCDAAFSRTVDLEFSCDKVVCVCVCVCVCVLSSNLLSGPHTLTSLFVVIAFDSTNSIICYSFHFPNSFCPSTTLERCLSHISSCTAVRSLAFDLFPSFYYHTDQTLTVYVLPLLFPLHFSRLTF